MAAERLADDDCGAETEVLSHASASAHACRPRHVGREAIALAVATRVRRHHAMPSYKPGGRLTPFLRVTAQSVQSITGGPSPP